MFKAPRGSLTERSKDYIIPSVIEGAPVIGDISLGRMLASASFFLRKKAIRNAELNQMEKVMHSWPELRAKFPTKLHEAFDTLYELSKKESDSEEYHTLLPNALHLTKETIAIHFNENKWYSFIPTTLNTFVN